MAITHELSREPVHSELYVPESLILDLDRMLVAIDPVMERVYASAEKIGLDPEPIRAGRNATEGIQSFEPLTYVRSNLDPAKPELFDEFKHDFVHGHGDDESKNILYPDAERFLRRLGEACVPYTVMTYGKIAEWQQLKVMATGYPMGYIVTDTKDKGPIIQAFQSPDGGFAMYDTADTVYRASTATLIDDKADAFKSYPQEPGYQGYWVKRGTLLPHQKGEVPANVQAITSLDSLAIADDGSLVYTDEHTTMQPSIEAAPQNPTVYIPLHPNVIALDHSNSLPAASSAPIRHFRLV